MELLPYADTEADRALTEELESDPEVMRELGGPHTAEEIAATHERRANQLELDDWWLKIVPESSGPAVGTIGIWPTEHDGERIYEVGWMVLPRHQGKGIASRALALLLERARADGRFGSVHAFPGVTNAASNGLCRKFGFRKLAERDVVYAGRELRVNHWALDLDDAG
jgi:RimJ/RimL family protein N-acetyltransferase